MQFYKIGHFNKNLSSLFLLFHCKNRDDRFLVINSCCDPRFLKKRGSPLLQNIKKFSKKNEVQLHKQALQSFFVKILIPQTFLFFWNMIKKRANWF